MIYVIGLGQNSGDLSVNAQKIISFCDLIVVKTALSSTYSYFIDNGIKHVTLDDIYKKSKDFASLNENIFKFLKSKEKSDSKIAYCVEGSGYDDKSVEYIYKNDVSLKIYEASSKGSGLFATSSVRYDANDIIYNDIFVPSDLPLSIYGIETKSVATSLKEKLLKYMDKETALVFSNSKERTTIKLDDLDKQLSYSSSSKITFGNTNLGQKKKFTYYDLVKIMRVLRGDNGCPWDKAQTNRTLRMEVLEDAYEVVNAIEIENDTKLLESLGDLILLPVFHALIAEDRKAFNDIDVLSSICKKLIFKHGHIFLGDASMTSGEGLSDRGRGQYDTVLKELQAMPKNFPALMRALKVQKKTNKIGFEICQKFMNFTRISAKLEELKTLNPTQLDQIELGIGQLLFLIVNFIRQYDIEPELALNAATDDFIKEFAKFEGLLYNQP